MSDIIKVAVRIPSDRKDEMLALAAQWRGGTKGRGPGWDAKAIAEVARNYGGYRKLFMAEGWPDVPGEKLMTTAPKLIVEKYGSIDAFLTKHEN